MFIDANEFYHHHPTHTLTHNLSLAVCTETALHQTMRANELLHSLKPFWL